MRLRNEDEYPYNDHEVHVFRKPCAYEIVASNLQYKPLPAMAYCSMRYSLDEVAERIYWSSLPWLMV